MTQPSMTERTAAFVAQVRGKLIVSCQALPHEPLFGAEIMARMAVAAVQGGGCAIRANTPPDIAAIRRAVSVPIIGLFKEDIPGYQVYITPTLAHAEAVAQAGADVIAIDATARPRPQPGDLADFIAAIHAATGLPVLADISTLAEGIAAEQAGADLISTTMSGYTPYSPQQSTPDGAVGGALGGAGRWPGGAAGRLGRPGGGGAARAGGATAVVVGGAITRPAEITRWFVAGMAR